MNKKYKPIPFWSWNDELDPQELTDQIEWMNDRGIGGFFMHARGGLTTPYLGERWFECIDACLKKAKELDMEAYAYDENGWPSGFAGGELLKNEEDRDCYLTYEYGPFNKEALVSYDVSKEKLVRTNKGDNCLNIYLHVATSTADVLNKDVVKKFIELTHEKYKEADKYNNLQGFFTDEPQYQRWGHPFTKCLFDYYKNNYQQDILDGLGLLFVEKEGYRSFRYNYWKALQDLMLNAYSKQVYEWCDKNNYKLTGHYVEEKTLAEQMMCCAGVMPFYEYEHIPGVDWLGRNIESDLAPKQVCSVAAQLGKKQILTESFAMVGWDATPEELKHIAEYQFVQGVNLLCSHLLPFKEHGQRKRDYPEHYSSINPWAEKHFKEFNDYLTSVGEKLATSTEIVDVALLHPIRSCYLNYKREDMFNSIKELDAMIVDVCNLLGSKHLSYHFIDETLLAKIGKVNGSVLSIGKCSYKYIIFPMTYTMDKTTEALLHQFVDNGGKVLLLYDKPRYLEGEEYEYSYLKSNISLEEIIKNQPYQLSENPNIRVNYRQDDTTGKRFFYIANLGEETSFTLNGHSYHFNKWESRIADEDSLEDDKETSNKKLYLSKDYRVSKPVDNYLTLDTLRISKDGKNYSEKMYHMCAFDKLLHERYEGELYLKYDFEITKVAGICDVLIENTNILEVRVNNENVNKKGHILEKELWVYDIASKLRKGNNEIVIRINYFQKEDVYYALFGENVTESLKNCLVYDTSIEPIYLKGIFGVYGDFKQGNNKEVLLCESFVIEEQKNHIHSLIEDGFPFFRGEIELEQDIEINDKNVSLMIPERYQTIDLFINNRFVKTMMFEHEIDISNFVKEGINNIKIKLIVSNRNLLGPHHYYPDEENTAVGPFTFERFGAWDENNKSYTYVDRYSFVKTII